MQTTIDLVGFVVDVLEEAGAFMDVEEIETETKRMGVDAERGELWRALAEALNGGEIEERRRAFPSESIVLTHWRYIPKEER